MYTTKKGDSHILLLVLLNPALGTISGYSRYYERPCLDRLAKQPIQFKYLDLRQTLRKTGDERRNHKRKLKS